MKGKFDKKKDQSQGKLMLLQKQNWKHLIALVKYLTLFSFQINNKI